MTREELFRPLALIAQGLSASVRPLFLGLLPEELHDGVGGALADVEHLDRAEMTVVEQVLVADLDVIFGEAGEGNSEWAEVLPLKVADVLATLVLHNTPRQAADVLRRLPIDLESDVLHLIAAQEWNMLARRLGPPELAFMGTLANEVGTFGRQADPEFAAEILRHGQNTSILRQILTQMYDKDPESTGQVQNTLFGFNDLGVLADRELQAVLRGVDHWDLILALGAAPASLRRKVLANISKRRAALLREDESVLEDADEAQVEMVQNQIMNRARLLYESGAVRTYLGSIARSESVAEDVLPEGFEGGKRNLGPPPKPTQKGQILRRAVIALFVLGLGYWGVTSLITMDMRQSARAGKRTKLTQASEDSAKTQPATLQKAKRASGGGAAAKISGQGMLISGQRVSSRDQDLKPGDRLQTQEGGHAAVEMWDNAGQVEVEGESDVQFGKEGDTKDEPPRLELRTGNIWVEVENPDLEVTSPLANVQGATGARYHFRISINSTTTLTVHKGSVTVRPQIESGTGLLVLGAGDQVTISADGRLKRGFHQEDGIWDQN